jgi:hypothetical protein
MAEAVELLTISLWFRRQQHIHSEYLAMAIVLAKTNFTFPNVTGAVQHQVRSINFGRTVQNVAVMLAGFNVQYNNGDHHVLKESIQLSIGGNNGGVVDVVANFLLRDGSGNIDDPYSGSIDAVVIADVV